MTDNILLIKVLFRVSLAIGVILRIIAVMNRISVRNVSAGLTPSQILSYIASGDKGLYRMGIAHKEGRSLFYGYSENLDNSSGTLTLRCGENDTGIYWICSVIHGYFLHKSASIKRAHYNFSRIMSFFIGLFSVLSLFLVSLGNNTSDAGVMTSAMAIYSVTFLCSVITSDFDIIASIESIRYINGHREIFSVNHYYAKRVFMGYIFHKISRSAAVIVLPLSMFAVFIV